MFVRLSSEGGCWGMVLGFAGGVFVSLFRGFVVSAVGGGVH